MRFPLDPDSPWRRGITLLLAQLLLDTAHASLQASCTPTHVVEWYMMALPVRRRARELVQTTTWTTPYRVPNTLLSDTEDSVVGTQWHQEAYSQLGDMLRDVAARRGAAWGVCEQIALIGLQHEDGTGYDPKPDVMVLGQPLPHGDLASVRIDRVGAPLFIAEMASDSTKEQDQEEKRLAYAAAGVSEYIVFDPSGHHLTKPLLAWRLMGGVFQPWPPTGDGWWHSATLDVEFRPGHPFVRVRDRDGREIAPSGLLRQHTRKLEHQTQELEQRLAEVEQARDEEARRRAELQELLRRLGDGDTKS